ncbi:MULTISPECIES: lipid-transfer protein [Mycolicibacterium]|uniref:propanoyl-CoA C-acyltransferase n=2 Tax=Mycolicibacterium TaxID=1866885 RepID=A1TC63_MYCVP|nr:MULTISPECIES: lipid-transfer protein [Mycolicibacterium]ABM14763.1 Thiolase [Mycolicibacterium vanbaalenii PYR-1]MCV7126163.1 lipid-transfer protein [Mycolicibacterium vanbaalenii PYR-1]MDN4520829.1 lipid-transfer protein [Mycolicibacterium austroafricanum]MDW5612297.1 lipid-transfer protein [Mycolicibacterium sp. D5.8-2]QRZ05132.1 lipid-transfer protein [Mycolicibacterium austroafricanum]
MTRRTIVAGVGMIPFTTPSRTEPYTVMAPASVREALRDAGIDYTAVQQAYVGYVYGDSTSGQAALYDVGLTAIPIVNVNNNCSTGSSALWLARQAIESGAADCVLALGFEQMQRGALGSKWPDRPSPFERFDEATRALQGWDDIAPMAAQYFGGAGRQYAETYGTQPETFARISVKARAHAKNNPYAVFRDEVTLDGVLGSPAVYGPLTRLQCCPPTCGAAAAVLVSEEFARRHGLRVEVAIKAQAMTTDGPTTFSGDMIKVVGYDMAKAAADRVYEDSGVAPEDIRVVELHDCFTANELITYEGLGLTPAGTAEKFILDGDNTYGGRVVTNPSGGLLSKGHPLGATGLAQCAELVWQLRGHAQARQVEGVTVALQHNIGLGGAAVVTLYEKVS